MQCLTAVVVTVTMGVAGDSPECPGACRSKVINSVLQLLAMIALNKSFLSCSHNADGV